MLPERHNLSSVVSVHLVKRVSDALVGKPSRMWLVSECAPTFDNDKNKPVSHFDFGRRIKQYAHVIQCEPSPVELRDPFSLGFVTRGKRLQHLTLVKFTSDEVL